MGQSVQEGEGGDIYDLGRFLEGQRDVYDQALAEIRQGRKRTHWMWFIFPQFQGLGLNSTSQFYAIKSRAEAQAYLAHPILGTRLKECCQAVLQVQGRAVAGIFRPPDDMKLRSCATLFASIMPPGSVFEGLLEKYFQGLRDARTLDMLA